MDDIPQHLSLNSRRFMDQFRVCIRSRYLVYKTEKTYCYWSHQFIRFHGYKHPREMSETEIDQFLRPL